MSAKRHRRAPGRRDVWSGLADRLGDAVERRLERRARPRPVLLVCSSGGHLLQLVQLRDKWAQGDRVWVTFPTDDASMIDGDRVIWAHHPTNRNVPNLLRNAVLAVRVIRRLRPRAIVSTGAGVAVPFCYVGRAFGARVVFVESFARITEPSLTARLVYPIAHEFFVQWPELLPRFKRARYEGSVFGDI